MLLHNNNDASIRQFYLRRNDLFSSANQNLYPHTLTTEHLNPGYGVSSYRHKINNFSVQHLAENDQPQSLVRLKNEMHSRLSQEIYSGQINLHMRRFKASQAPEQLSQYLNFSNPRFNILIFSRHWSFYHQINWFMYSISNQIMLH